MPRIRYLKPDFFTDEHIAELKYQERLVFQGLWCHADRKGRLEDKPKFLKVSILPYDNEDMEKILARLSLGAKPFIIRYEVDGKKYIQVTNFLKHQHPHHTERDSLIPEYIYQERKEEEKEEDKTKRSVHEASRSSIDGLLTVKQTVNKEYVDDFITFWGAYPKKTGKDAAYKSWLSRNPPLARCLSTIEWQSKTEQWTKEKGKFIPMPATWINQGRWKDEPIKQLFNGNGAAPIPGKYDNLKTIICDGGTK